MSVVGTDAILVVGEFGMWCLGWRVGGYFRVGSRVCFGDVVLANCGEANGNAREDWIHSKDDALSICVCTSGYFQEHRSCRS